MTGDRIMRLMLAFATAGAALVSGLLYLMWGQHDEWIALSYGNRWAFRDVPTRRGAILDRNGTRIAWDEPGLDLELRYRAFRRSHPIGIAVHGANLLECSLGREPRFRLEHVDRGAHFREACELLLRTPVGLLGPHVAEFLRGVVRDPKGLADLLGSLSEVNTRDLRFYSCSMLGRLSGLDAYRFHAALRKAAADFEQRELTVLEVGRAVCASRRTRPGAAVIKIEFQEFDRSIYELEALAVRLGPKFDLFAVLGERQDAWRLWRMFELLPDVMRRAMGDQAFWLFMRDNHALEFADWRDFVARNPAKDEVGNEKLAQAFVELDEDRRDELAAEAAVLGEQSPAPPLPWNEDVPRSIARRVRYVDAVWLRIVRRRHPGFSLMPSVRRATGALPGRSDWAADAGRLGTLSLLLGSVTPAWKRDATAQLAANSHALGTVGVGAFLDDWPEDLPPSLADDVARSAGRAVHRHYLTVGRFGRGGVEGALDDRLRGAPGMRFVERDRQREQRLFSALDVDAGEDVRLTIDLRLQAMLEQCLLEADEGFERGATILDAISGDILAIVGLPLGGQGGQPRRFATPALMATRNAAIGSVIKPFVALEHLESMRLGLPCAMPSDFRDCDARFNRNLSCSHAHGAVGRHLVHAIGQSCNFYFYCAIRGLGDEGLVRALRRVGWLDESGDAATPPAYVRHVEGLAGGVSAPHRPRHSRSRVRIELQGIGYGIHVNTMFVARAYAALATGALLPPRMVLGGPVGRPVPLAVAPKNLELVRAGLRECVVSGTARRVDFPPLGLFGKTGTAEVGTAAVRKNNNSWFAGFLPPGRSAQLAFAVALYEVPPSRGGGKTAAPVIARLLERMLADPELAATYLPAVR